MPKHQNKNMPGHPASPVVGPLTALHKMAKHPAAAVMRAQDYVVTTSRRIVASGGLHGSTEWRVPSGANPEHDGPRTHPSPTSEEKIHELHIDLTPGCMLQFSAACLPCGETQVPDGSGGWLAGGAEGRIDLSITWWDRAGNRVDTTHTVELPPNTAQWGDAPQAAGGFFPGLRVVEILDIHPPLPNIIEQSRWSRHVSARVIVHYVGGARVVDWALYEVPHIYALPMAEPDDMWCSHFFGNGKAAAKPNQFNHPQTRQSIAPGDRRYGTHQMMVVQLNQRLRLGPHLVHWSAHSEGSGTASAGIVHKEFIETGGFRRIYDASQTAYDAGRAGWPMGCGGYARRWDDNGDLILRNRIATIPVYVWVFASHIGTGSSTFRFATSPRSYVDVPIGDGGFYVAYGHLTVGINPEQLVVGQEFVSHTGDGFLLAGSFGVARADQWNPAYVGPLTAHAT